MATGKIVPCFQHQRSVGWWETHGTEPSGLLLVQLKELPFLVHSFLEGNGWPRATFWWNTCMKDEDSILASNYRRKRCLNIIHFLGYHCVPHAPSSPTTNCHTLTPSTLKSIIHDSSKLTQEQWGYYSLGRRRRGWSDRWVYSDFFFLNCHMVR